MGAGASAGAASDEVEIHYPRQSIAEISRQSKLSFVAVLREVGGCGVVELWGCCGVVELWGCVAALYFSC